MIEFADIPTGIQALDALAKQAEVVVGAAGTVQCGRYLILFGGEVQAVQFAFARAQLIASDSIADSVLLPHAHAGIDEAILHGKLQWPAPGDTLGVVQTSSSPTMVGAVDAALKGAEVQLVELRIADGLGGKAVATLWGELADIQAAVGIATERIASGVSTGSKVSVIARADETVMRAVCAGTRFFQEWRG